MSLSVCIFFNESVSMVSEWQGSLDMLGFPLILEPGGTLASLSGYLPARWNGREAGFECSLGAADEIIQCYDNVDLEGPWQYGIELFYRTFPECAGAIMAAAALAHATGGIVYDPQEGAMFDAVAAAEYARETVISIPDIEARFERGEFSR